MQLDSNNGNPVYSMTGYGEAEVELDGRKLEASIRTYNHDGTSISVRGLDEDQATLHKAEELLKESFPRGRIEARIKTRERSGLPPEELDREAIRGSYESLSELAEDLGLIEGPTLGDLISLDLLHTKPPYEGAWSQIKEALSEAVSRTRRAQRKEGERIREDLLGHLDEIDRRLDEAEEGVPEVVDRYKRNLRERISDLLEGDEAVVGGRELETEVAKFADKVDVNEEISRARTHVNSARDALKSGGLVGKKLKFLSQELQREINTLGAKSKDGDIQGEVIEMKLALEKFKEQSRNLA
ncbi:MAG: YicC family protein [Candidatus Acetothermia bacterium]